MLRISKGLQSPFRNHFPKNTSERLEDSLVLPSSQSDPLTSQGLWTLILESETMTWRLPCPSGHRNRLMSLDREKKQLGGAFPQARGIFSCGAQRLVKNSFSQWERALPQATRVPSTQQTMSTHSRTKRVLIPWLP